MSSCGHARYSFVEAIFDQRLFPIPWEANPLISNVCLQLNSSRFFFPCYSCFEAINLQCSVRYLHLPRYCMPSRTRTSSCYYGIDHVFKPISSKSLITSRIWEKENETEPITSQVSCFRQHEHFFAPPLEWIKRNLSSHYHRPFALLPVTGTRSAVVQQAFIPRQRNRARPCTEWSVPSHAEFERTKTNFSEKLGDDWGMPILYPQRTTRRIWVL